MTSTINGRRLTLKNWKRIGASGDQPHLVPSVLAQKKG